MILCVFDLLAEHRSAALRFRGYGYTVEVKSKAL